jgi:hypothetical protein
LGAKKRPPVLRRASFHFDFLDLLSQDSPRAVVHTVVVVMQGG